MKAGRNPISAPSNGTVAPSDTPYQIRSVDRLNQLASQIQVSPRRTRRRKSTPEAPADYSDILEQLSTLHTLARTPDPSHRGYVRQKAAGKLWVRERVEALLDDGSLREIGSVAGEVVWREEARKAENSLEVKRESPAAFTPSNSVQGFGKLVGRSVLLTADDYSLRAGHADGALAEKTLYVEKLALSLRLPNVKLVDGSSGGGSVTTIRKYGFSYVPPLPAFDVVVKQLNAGIPNLGAVLGPAIGLGAARVTICHFSVMAGNIGALFNAGPKVVKDATFEEDLTLRELGGPDMHCRNGTIDNYAPDEHSAFEQLKMLLSYLPNSGLASPPVITSSDDPNRTDLSLRSAIPRNKSRTYDMRRLMTTVTDTESFFEIGSLWGETVITGVARLAGRPVGIIANNPTSSTGGALDAPGSQKLTRHLKFCDVFNLPLLQFVDVPGYAVGTAAERAATMKFGVETALAYYTTSMPVFNILVRRCYGVAGGVMMDCRDPRMRIAWPSGDWGSLPLAGGIEASHAHELREAVEEGGDEAGRRKFDSLKGEYERLMNPVRTANAFGIEEVVDPKDTRSIVCAWAKRFYDEGMSIRLGERTAGTLRPQFA
ncbi:MAG: hypothetical protein Q9159_005196 [Coniocarpon cinnabarinum]